MNPSPTPTHSPNNTNASINTNSSNTTNSALKQNLLSNIPQHLPHEFFETLIQNNSLKIERIVSKGHCSPENFWYNQQESEWVLVLQGEAILEFEHSEVLLKKGDCLNIASHQKHRVKWTKPHEETIWLAVFY